MPTDKTILLNTTKYDGSLHYRFDTKIVYQGENTLAVYGGPDRTLESYRGTFNAEGHVLSVFFSDAYHNIAIMWKRDWEPRLHYVNIATPATWDETRVTAVDLDLDLIRFSNTEDIILDDEDEFLEHKKSMNYPQELVSRCHAEVEKLTATVASRKGLFSDDIFAWRYGTDLSEILNKLG